jgi:hypothetical protein
MTLVCPHCFGERGLTKQIEEIRPDFPNEKCSFHPQYKGVPIKAVAAIVDAVFRAHYGFADYGYDGEQLDEPLEFVIGDLVQAVDDQIARALVTQLVEDDDYWPPDGGEAFYDETNNYQFLKPHFFRHSGLWKEFCEGIVHRQRFFNTDVRELIAEIFDGVQYQRDHKSRPAVYRIEPGKPPGCFFRARLADEISARKKITENLAKELGPPPERLRKAGRMNPAGVCCFYGAFDMQTCIAELRPRVGNIVIGAQFDLVRPVYVLDITRFNAPIKPTSLFARTYLERQEQWAFMQNFRHEIARPISPNDEHLDYIPTQAVAEYLLHHHEFKRGGKPVKIEAVIFQSAQNPSGKNIAMLGDAANVVAFGQAEKKTKRGLSASRSVRGILEVSIPRANDRQKPALRVDLDSVEIREVSGAQFNSKSIEKYTAQGDDGLDF